MLQKLLDDAKQFGFCVSKTEGQELLKYLDLLRVWNKTHNLCADASYQHMLAYHILDSISVAANINCEKKNILDVGTGAGLPGIPLAVVVPSCNITLLDQKIKKITFVRHAVNVLQLSNVSIAAERVERFTGKFDLIISRAFSDLQDFVRLSKHLCAKQGILVAMKSDPSFFVVGADCGEGYKIIEVKELKVPGVSAKRSLVIIAK